VGGIRDIYHVKCCCTKPQVVTLENIINKIVDSCTVFLTVVYIKKDYKQNETFLD